MHGNNYSACCMRRGLVLASDKLRDSSHIICSSCKLIMLNQAFWGSDHLDSFCWASFWVVNDKSATFRSSYLAMSIYSLQLFSTMWWQVSAKDCGGKTCFLSVGHVAWCMLIAQNPQQVQSHTGLRRQNLLRIASNCNVIGTNMSIKCEVIPKY